MEETHILSLETLKRWYSSKYRGARFPIRKRITLTTQYFTEMFKDNNWEYAKILNSKATDTWTVTIRKGVLNVKESY